MGDKIKHNSSLASGLTFLGFIYSIALFLAIIVVAIITRFVNNFLPFDMTELYKSPFCYFTIIGLISLLSPNVEFIRNLFSVNSDTASYIALYVGYAVIVLALGFLIHHFIYTTVNDQKNHILPGLFFIIMSLLGANPLALVGSIIYMFTGLRNRKNIDNIEQIAEKNLDFSIATNYKQRILARTIAAIWFSITTLLLIAIIFWAIGWWAAGGKSGAKGASFVTTSFYSTLTADNIFINLYTNYFNMVSKWGLPEIIVGKSAGDSNLLLSTLFLVVFLFIVAFLFLIRICFAVKDNKRHGVMLIISIITFPITLFFDLIASILVYRSKVGAENVVMPSLDIDTPFKEEDKVIEEKIEDIVPVKDDDINDLNNIADNIAPDDVDNILATNNEPIHVVSDQGGSGSGYSNDHDDYSNVPPTIINNGTGHGHTPNINVTNNHYQNLKHHKDYDHRAFDHNEHTTAKRVAPTYHVEEEVYPEEIIKPKPKKIKKQYSDLEGGDGIDDIYDDIENNDPLLRKLLKQQANSKSDTEIAELKKMIAELEGKIIKEQHSNAIVMPPPPTVLASAPDSNQTKKNVIFGVKSHSYASDTENEVVKKVATTEEVKPQRVINNNIGGSKRNNDFGPIDEYIEITDKEEVHVPQKTASNNSRSTHHVVKTEENYVSFKARKEFNPLLLPNKYLSPLVGKEPITRAEALKRVWAYIRDEELQDDEERRVIHIHGLLANIVPEDKKTISMTEVPKYVSKNLLDEHNYDDSYQQKTRRILVSDQPDIAINEYEDSKNRSLRPSTKKIMEKITPYEDPDESIYHDEKDWRATRAFNHLVMPLPPIIPVIGTNKPLTRAQAIKLTWKYIKENNLQNKREIKVDDVLHNIIPEDIDKITMFTLPKYVNKYLKADVKIVTHGDETKIVDLKPNDVKKVKVAKKVTKKKK